MDSRLYIKRAENEIKLAGMIFKLSKDTKIQTDVFDIKDPETYYSSAIIHSYYSIFYAAKAMLLREGITTDSPDVHKNTLEAFEEHLVATGKLDVQLLNLYKTVAIRADSLLEIFKEEKKKRGRFTYRTLPQANQEPAKESIDHAKTFFKHMFALCN